MFRKENTNKMARKGARSCLMITVCLTCTGEAALFSTLAALQQSTYAEYYENSTGLAVSGTFLSGTFTLDSCAQLNSTSSNCTKLVLSGGTATMTQTELTTTSSVSTCSFCLSLLGVRPVSLRELCVLVPDYPNCMCDTLGRDVHSERHGLHKHIPGPRVCISGVGRHHH